MLLVQEFLEKYSFQDLIDQHGVYASFDKTGYKFSLNYDMIETKENDPLAQQCRGLILSSSNGKSLKEKAIEINGRLSYNKISPGKTEVLGVPMFRFFNDGQGAAAKIDWKDPKLSILEKLDGTLIICYFDKFKGEWCIATRSVPEADLIMDNGKYTFRGLFEKAVKETFKFPFDTLIKYFRTDITYCFELMSPLNRIVVRYDDYRIALLAMRNIEFLQEIDIDSSHLMNDVLRSIKVKKYNLSSLDEVINFVSSQNPLEMEGVVIRDGKFNRIKVKNAQYIAFNKCRDSLASSPRNVLELILSEKDDDVLQALPQEIADDLLSLKEKVRNAISNYDLTYKEIMDKLGAPSKKEFAIELQTRKDLWQAPFFSFYDQKSLSMRDFITKNKKEGTWGNGFLDKMLEIAK